MFSVSLSSLLSSLSLSDAAPRLPRRADGVLAPLTTRGPVGEVEPLTRPFARDESWDLFDLAAEEKVTPLPCFKELLIEFRASSKGILDGA